MDDQGQAHDHEEEHVQVHVGDHGVDHGQVWDAQHRDGETFPGVTALP